MKTLEEEDKYSKEHALLIEEYGSLQGQSDEDKVQYILSHGGCTFEDFRKEIIEEIKKQYEQ